MRHKFSQDNNIEHNRSNTYKSTATSIIYFKPWQAGATLCQCIKIIVYSHMNGALAKLSMDKFNASCDCIQFNACS